MNSDHVFKDYCLEYLECSAVLNGLRQDSEPDIAKMHKVISRMEELEQEMLSVLEQKRIERITEKREKMSVYLINTSAVMHIDNSKCDSMCGDCISCCPGEALTEKDGKIFFSNKACTLCETCCDVCPNDCIRIEFK